MTAAALTPRVRIMVICDDVIPDELEEGVFTLERVRQSVVAPTFPYQKEVHVFLLLSSARKGTYPAHIRVMDEQTNKAVRYVKFKVTFSEDYEMIPLFVDISPCEFRQPGPYVFEVWFSAPDGSSAQKGEQTLYIVTEEE